MTKELASNKPISFAEYDRDSALHTVVENARNER
jgi:hypothetical protein